MKSWRCRPREAFGGYESQPRLAAALGAPWLGGKALALAGPRGNAPDCDLLAWARSKGYVVLTQDLDFSQILYATSQTGPSVVLLRMDNEFDAAARHRVCAALREASGALAQGALLTISPGRVRVRNLPIIPLE